MELIFMFTLFVLEVLQVDTVSGLSCLSCKGTMQPRHCHQVEKCQIGQYCAVERYFDQYNDVYYDLLCKDSAECPITNTTDPNAHCVECCNSDLCNSKGCVAQGFTQEIGPLCYNCKSLVKGRECHQIDICDNNEVCFVDETEEMGDILVDSGCRTNTNCHIRNTPGPWLGSIIGKRDLAERSLSHAFCTNCCETNLCNDDCSVGNPSGTAKSTSTTASTTTKTSTTTLTTTTTPTSTTTTTPVTSTSTTTPTPTTTSPSRSKSGGNSLSSEGYDCLDIHTRMPQSPPGPYKISIGGSRSLMVWCDMTTASGGWTVFQKRFNGSVDFYQNSTSYRDGFGNIHGEFWLGLENVYQLTVGHKNSLRVDIVTNSGTHQHDDLQSFNISPGPQYVLHVTTTGHQMSEFNGYPFTTKDVDRDSYSEDNCAVMYRGAFWYSACFGWANPNGPYRPGHQHGYDMTYFDDTGNRAMEMKFRRVV